MKIASQGMKRTKKKLAWGDENGVLGNRNVSGEVTDGLP